jgi:protein-disulfide isomerase
VADLQIPIHAGDRTRGAEDAPAALVMYGDYECPYTRAAYRVVQKLLAGEPDELRFVFRHFPLTSIHPHAQQAAEAAEAAGAQGKFWEMHDALFAHQHALEEADLLRYAQDLTLDTEQFEREVTGHSHAQRIVWDVESGLASDVQGTPTLFLNGELLTEGYDEATLRAAIASIAADRRSSP